ncbi:MAG: glycosyltransferase family 4 protein [Anaerolineaceae bacterium]
MHILLIHQAFSSLNEAGGTRHHEIAAYLAEKGHQVTIITSAINYLTGRDETGQSTETSSIAKNRLTILHAYMFPALHRSFFHRVFSFVSFMVSSFLTSLRVKNVDLVWGTTPPIFQGVTSWLVARLKGVPFLFEVRDLWPAFAIAIGVLNNPLLIKASLWLEKFLYRRADCVVVNSPGYIRHVTERGAKHVKLIPNGADPDMFDPAADGSVFRKQHGLEDKFVVLYAGAHGISNDLDTVLEAAKILRSNANIAIVLVGDGKEKSRLQQTAADLSLENVLFIPPVPKNEISGVLAGAHACIAILKPLDLYKTTYPNKVFDYFAAGRPVVLAIDGVIREVVEEAKAGLFVEPGNSRQLAKTIIKLAANPQSALEMGLSGRKFIEDHFNRRSSSDSMLSLMKEMRDPYG